jgi:hypothetical protein
VHTTRHSLEPSPAQAAPRRKAAKRLPSRRFVCCDGPP